MLIQRLIQRIRSIPGAILRLLRAILVPMVLRGASMVPKFLHVRRNSTSSRLEGEPSRRGASYSIVATSLAPASAAALLLSGPYGDAANNSFTSLPSAVNTPNIPLSVSRVTPVTILSAKFKPAAPEQIERHKRRKPTYVPVHVL